MKILLYSNVRCYSNKPVFLQKFSKSALRVSEQARDVYDFPAPSSLDLSLGDFSQKETRTDMFWLLTIRYSFNKFFLYDDYSIIYEER